MQQLKKNATNTAKILSKANDVYSLSPGVSGSPITYTGEVFFVAAAALPSRMVDGIVNGQPNPLGGEPFAGVLKSAPYTGANKTQIDTWLTATKARQSATVSHTLVATFGTADPDILAKPLVGKNAGANLTAKVAELRKTIPTLATDPCSLDP